MYATQFGSAVIALIGLADWTCNARFGEFEQRNVRDLITKQ